MGVKIQQDTRQKSDVYNAVDQYKLLLVSSVTILKNNKSKGGSNSYAFYQGRTTPGRLHSDFWFQIHLD